MRIEASSAALQARRNTIIATADALLAECGLEGLTIRAVLHSSGLARRAFYDVFASKDDLILAMFEHVVRDAARELGKRIAAIQQPAERLRCIVLSIVNVHRTTDEDAIRRDLRAAAYSREHLRLAEARPAELQRVTDPLIALIERQIVDGVADGSLKSDAPRMSAVLLYNLVSTTVHSELLTKLSQRHDPARREELARQIWNFCARALLV